MYLDLHCSNFGIQEFNFFSKEEMEVFLGCPVVKRYVYLNDTPSIGVALNEEEAINILL